VFKKGFGTKKKRGLPMRRYKETGWTRLQGERRAGGIVTYKVALQASEKTS